MPRVGFEPSIPVFERAKTVHALDRAATMIGNTNTTAPLLFLLSIHFLILRFSFQLRWGEGEIR
jgi:hypothetical protein